LIDVWLGASLIWPKALKGSESCNMFSTFRLCLISIPRGLVFGLHISAAQNLIGLRWNFKLNSLKLALKMRNFRIIDGAQKSISVFAMVFAAFLCVFWVHKSMQFRKLHL